ncbi:glycosyl hydrolase, family 31 protein [Cardiosporidium cionae]|uniref:Glucosidase II subunit alpha n=1 Tax=Cardiosporidium cionae TaxID=476202 RepID=A0ABQ7JAV6_9APIC|nr:glycosyl hydrolase, family 31 protein [Cardiosporidium cionae]|eukprot:KAF8821116.1 glycosyl hydrolase, family 31 protein [Cardiosporidium cionae]
MLACNSYFFADDPTLLSPLKESAALQTREVVEPVLSDAAVKPVLSDAAVKPVLSDAAVKPVLSDATVEPVLSDATVEPVLSDATVEPVLSDATVEPVLSDATVEPVISNAIVEREISDATELYPIDLWEQKIFAYSDSIPCGPSSVGVDISFPNSKAMYGLFEHATDLLLPFYEEPYRFYNLDVFAHKSDSPDALYASIPMITSLHQTPNSSVTASAILWVNPADTRVKLDKSSGSSNSWWVSETGVIDLLIFTGPSPQAVLQQYYVATGFPLMHNLFAIGKHQCRWNYMSTKDVLEVDANFDKYDIPYDTIWLDIEHTDNKMYFTWDPQAFLHLETVPLTLDEKGRHLVLIVDPHVKESDNYFVYSSAVKKDYLVKTQQQTTFVGKCWPGSSVYPDMVSTEVRKWWGNFYAENKIIGGCDNVHIWNDMNEPSVFESQEITMPKSNLHRRNLDDAYVEHREIHNLFGMYFVRSTFSGLIQRNANQRPFILSRAAFIGQHQYSFLWTGDNTASWDHMKLSIPMILSGALCGFSAIGADTGGFFGSPNSELLIRWHQLGIWYPFYREHATLESPRREPWLFEESYVKRHRNAVRVRYSLLPYTLFAEFAMAGKPIVRPLWWQELSNATLYNIQDSFLVGDAILVKPIDKPMSDSEDEEFVSVYLPNKSGAWYNFWTGEIAFPGTHLVPVSLENIPIFVASGSIIPKRQRHRRSIERITLWGLVCVPFTISCRKNGIISSLHFDVHKMGEGRFRVDIKLPKVNIGDDRWQIVINEPKLSSQAELGLLESPLAGVVAMEEKFVVDTPHAS